MSFVTKDPLENGQNHDSSKRVIISWWIPLIISALLLFWFYGFEFRYGGARDESAFSWLWSSWNDENDYEHGFLFPLIIAGIIIHRFKTLKATATQGSLWGLIVVLIGSLLYITAYRTLQPRVAIGALPFLLWGSAWFLWGSKVAKILFLPLFFFWFAIPLPSFQQATTHLQLLATSFAHHGSAIFGVETIVQGNMISSAHDGWEPLKIAKGCSGIRSLMALLMITGAWACLSDMALWKRALLFFSALPLAIIGNALRVISIFVIGEYGNAQWARDTWHDWSGLLLFYPFSIILLLAIHSILEGGLPWNKTKCQLRRVTVIRTQNGEESKPNNLES